MSWGHAISDDLALWQELAPALMANGKTMVFSGSAVMDGAGSAGFGRAAMAALYTAAATGETQHQSQSLAYSLDNGKSWMQHPGNPVLDLGMADFRDPFVFRHQQSESWVMIVVKSNEQVAQIYRSPDLANWKLASEIHAETAPGLIWECPTLVELPVLGGEGTRWLFKVDALHDAPGAGALCRIGQFDGFRFEPESEWRVVDQGRDFYAAIAWNGPLDAEGRPAWIGWMGNHAYQHDFPKRGWRGVMSLPRRMGLVQRDGALVLSQQVEPSVDRLFDDFGPLPDDGFVPVASRIELAREFAGTLVVSDLVESSFTLRAESARWVVVRHDTALPFLDAKFTLERRENDALSIWLDSETVEVVTSDGTGWCSFQHRPAQGKLKIHADRPEWLSVATLI